MLTWERRTLLFLVGMCVLTAIRTFAADEALPMEVVVHDSGVQYSQGGYGEHAGHKWERHTITLDNGVCRYGFLYNACVDPSHPDRRANNEGYLGMPSPSSANWYHGGFLFININGNDVGGYPLLSMQPIETGARGTIHMVWDHPDAEVRVRIMLPGRANYVLTDISWKPKPHAEIKTIGITARCYPSFFTSWHRRQGERHCQTPRIDEKEPNRLTLQPDKDLYLFYYDTIFDVAKGEGEGPCAMMFTPDCIRSGRVEIGDYAVTTILEGSPEAGRIRLAFWDFTGKKNADAETWMKQNYAAVQKQLAETDFRPDPVVRLNVAATKSEATRLLTEAGEEGKPLQAKTEETLSRMETLKAQADNGDWKAETELASLLTEYQTLLWKLKIAALLGG